MLNSFIIKWVILFQFGFIYRNKLGLIVKSTIQIKCLVGCFVYFSLNFIMSLFFGPPPLYKRAIGASMHAALTLGLMVSWAVISLFYTWFKWRIYKVLGFFPRNISVVNYSGIGRKKHIGVESGFLWSQRPVLVVSQTSF